MKTCFLTFIFSVLLLFLTNCATASLIKETEPNNTLAIAQNLDGFFSLDSVDINENSNCDIRDCNTIPHVTVHGQGDTTGSLDFYSFTHTAHSTLIVDIDYNTEPIWLVAFDKAGNPLFDMPFGPENSGTINPDTIDGDDDPWAGWSSNYWPATWPDTITITLGLISFDASNPPNPGEVIDLSNWTGFTGPEKNYCSSPSAAYHLAHGFGSNWNRDIF